MAQRTIPATFPTLLESEFHARKILRASRVRMLAHAQNYIWANAYRVYAGHAYEGNGSWMRAGFDDPAVQNVPGGGTGKRIATFLVPRNWSASPRLRLTGRSRPEAVTGKATGRVIFTLHDMSGAYRGARAVVEYEATFSSDQDWETEMQIPQDGTYQVQVWLASSLLNDAAENPVGDRDELLCFSARYATANEVEAGGPIHAWQPIAHSIIGGEPPVAAALLRTLIRNMRHIWSQRPPEICQSWVGNIWGNTSSFREVGRYRVWVSPNVSHAEGRIGIHCTHGGAGNEVRVLRNGTLIQTFTALPVGYSEINIAPFTVAGGSEPTITVEARSTASGSNWGTMVLGVWIWERIAALGLPPGTSVPLAYQPVDEGELEADDFIREEEWRRIVRNDTWLAANRLRTLVGDWRHRTYKRVGTDWANGEQTVAFDFTPGPDDPTLAADDPYVGAPKNITLQAGLIDLTGNGSAGAGQRDGLARWASGQADPADVNTWPTPSQMAQTIHGKRLGRYRLDGGLASPISAAAGARVRWYARARRLRPAGMKTFNAPYDNGPEVEEGAWQNRAELRQYLGGISGVPIALVGANGKPDHELEWYGPALIAAANVGAEFTILGNLARASGSYPPHWHSLEGQLFEVEMASCLILDHPLTQSELNTL